MGLRMGLFGVALLAVFVVVSTSSAVPLRMDYQITDLGGSYDYEFNLSLDNHDNSWVPGMGWGWIVFGDRADVNSPIEDFVGDPSDLWIGPFGSYDLIGGANNGPILMYGSNYNFGFWTPTAIGEELNWSGTSANYVGQGEMYFSSLVTIGGVDPTFFELAHLVAPAAIPEPCSMLLLGIGLAGIAGARIRRKHSA